MSTKLSFEQSPSTNSFPTLNQEYFFDQEDSNQIFHPKRIGDKKHKDGSKCKKKREMKSKGLKHSLWKIEQNVAYMNFLRQNQSVMEGNENLRRARKINKSMSQAVKSRTADQCGSHHQKMMKHHRDIPNIIKYIETLMEEKNMYPTSTYLEPLLIIQEFQSVEQVEIIDIISLERSYSYKNAEEFIINSIFDFQSELCM